MQKQNEQLEQLRQSIHANDIVEEQYTLLDLQARHAEQLAKKGILDVAKQKLRELPVDSLSTEDNTALAIGSGLLRASVALTPVWKDRQDPKEKPVRVPAVRFTPVEAFFTAGADTSKVTSEYVPLVTYDDRGTLQPAEGFSYEDLNVVSGMIHGLEIAKQGGLPHLNESTLATITPEVDITTARESARRAHPGAR